MTNYTHWRTNIPATNMQTQWWMLFRMHTAKPSSSMAAWGYFFHVRISTKPIYTLDFKFWSRCRITSLKMTVTNVPHPWLKILKNLHQVDIPNVGTYLECVWDGYSTEIPSSYTITYWQWNPNVDDGKNNKQTKTNSAYKIICVLWVIFFGHSLCVCQVHVVPPTHRNMLLGWSAAEVQTPNVCNLF